MVDAGFLTKKIKDYVLRNEGDLVGITPVERMSVGPEGYRPTDIMPNSKFVIVVGKRILKGLMNTAPSHCYGAIGYVVLGHELDEIAYRVGRLIESEGFIALPIPQTTYGHYDALTMMGKGPHISHRHAAAAAGLGEMSPISTLFLSPEFGPRERLTSIITTATLVSDSPFKGSLCEECMECVYQCPAGAISEEGGVDKQRCWANLWNNEGKFGYGVCGVCMKVCPVGKDISGNR